MNYKMIGGILSRILGVEAVFLLPSLFLALADGQTKTALSFLFTALLVAGCAVTLFFTCRNASRKFYAKEGMVCVGSAWILMSLLGCLPFCLSGEIPSFIDAFFEMVSGFTTTGASVVTDVEALSRAVLYWRSFSHWLGGMGVLVFILAVTPAISDRDGFSMHLLRAESPGPDVGKLAPKMRRTAGILYLLYIILTIVNILFLLLGGMPFFDSLCIAFGTAGTGGFAILGDSIASYSPYLQNVCTVFMFLFGVNFGLFHLILLGQFRAALKNEEMLFYTGTTVVSALLIAWNIRGIYATVGETLRHSFFQVVSVMTTTGFATTDYNGWPVFSRVILLMLMMVGACAGSTGGGLKCARILIFWKSFRRQLAKLLHPNRVSVIRIGGEVVDENILRNTSLYLTVYMLLLCLSVIAVSPDSPTVTTAFSSVLACFNNIGPGLDASGPAANYAFYGVFSKLILIFDMLAGRLELFPLLALLSPKTWKRGA